VTDDLAVDSLFGDAIPGVFPPDGPTARFVVSMSMAHNDIDRTLRDLLRSHNEDGQDFTYRVRLSVGHLVEAIDALNTYSQEFPARCSQRCQTPPSGTSRSSVARSRRPGRRRYKASGTTFHYPSPAKDYSPTSDAQLQAALAGMGNRGTEYHLDGDTKAVTFTYADDAAIRLAVGTATDQEVLHRFEVARDGAIASIGWAKALITTYVEVNEQTIGEPRITEKKKRTDTA
jgi:hypothetical protein